jgi:hypothetical protein
MVKIPVQIPTGVRAICNKQFLGELINPKFPFAKIYSHGDLLLLLLIFHFISVKNLLLNYIFYLQKICEI